MLKKDTLVITQSPKKSFNKSTYYLGHWCLNLNKKNILSKFKNTKIHDYHWSNKPKLRKDFKFIEKFLEKILDTLYKSLNKIHNTHYDKKYWRTVLYPWLAQYVPVVFDRWESIDTFVKKNRSKIFLVNDEYKTNYNYTPKDYLTFFNLASSNSQWNDALFKKIILFRNIKNLIFKKKIIFTNRIETSSVSLKRSDLKFFLDKIISKIAFTYNDIIFESFYFPLKEYLDLNIKNRLLPARYSSFFVCNDSNNKISNSLRKKLHDSLKKKDKKKNFYNFLIDNISSEIPINYLENFKFLREKAIKISNKKKIIFSMHSWHHNDFFRIYIGETVKKNNSKFIIADHGGGFSKKLDLNNNYHKEICFKKINWFKKKGNFYPALSPTHPIISKKKYFKVNKDNENITILYSECSSYQTRMQSIPFFCDEVENYIEFILALKKLDKKNKKKLLFRLKEQNSLKTDQVFAEVFGKNLVVDKNTFNFYDNLLSSKIVLVSYPTTSYSESMYLNLPTILFCKKKVWMFSNSSLKIFKQLKKNNMAFENYNEMIKFLNKNYETINNWWNQKKIQQTRKEYLKNFFNINQDWNKDWTNYVNLLKKNN